MATSIDDFVEIGIDEYKCPLCNVSLTGDERQPHLDIVHSDEDDPDEDWEDDDEDEEEDEDD